MQRLVAVGTALIAVTYGLARFALGLFVPEFRATFDLSPIAVGWVLAGSFAGYVGALMVAGALVTRFGARAVAVGSGAVAAVGMAGLAAAPRPVVLGAAATVAGSSTGLVSPALATAVEQRLASIRRPTAQTAINAGTSLGLIVAVPVAALVSASWRAAWLVFALAAVAASTAAAVVLPPESRPRTRTGAERPGRLSVRLRITAVALGVSSAAFWTFGRELLETAWGLPPSVARSAWVAVGVGGLAGAAAGLLAGRAGLRAALVVGWAALAGSLAWLAAGSSPPILTLGLAGLFGAGYMALTGLLIVWSVRERPRQPGAAVAAAFLMLAAGQVAGAPTAGALAGHFGLPAAFLGAAAMATGAGLTALPPRRGAAALAAADGPAPADCRA